MKNIHTYSKIHFFKQLIILCCLMSFSETVSSQICDFSVLAEPVCNEDCTYDFNIIIEGTGVYNITVNGEYLAIGLEAGSHQVGPVFEPFYNLYIEDINELDCYQELSGAWECENCQIECPVMELSFQENSNPNSPILFCPFFCAFNFYDNYTITEISAESGSTVGIEQGGICVNFIMADTFTKDTFSITACNPSGICETVTYIVTIKNLSLYDDYVDIPSNTSVTIDVLANDFGTDLDLTSFTTSEHGTVVQSGTSLVYTPSADYIGEDIIEYTACGIYLGEEECGTSTIFINVGLECQPYMSIEMAAGESVTICPSYCDLSSPITIVEIVSPENSNTEPLEDGCFIYNAQPGVSYEQISVLACSDLVGDCNDWTITINIDDSGNYPFITEPDFEITTQGQQVTVCILENDIIATDNYEIELVNPDFGIIELTPENCVNYTSPSSYTGPATFYYQICDTAENCSDLTFVTVFVEDESLLVANDDYEATDMNIEVIISPLANDVLSEFSDINTTTIDVIGFVDLLEEPENGEVLISYGDNCSDASGCVFFLYTPNVDFSGLDQFTYVLCGPETCDTATVNIQVGINCSAFCVWPGDANNDGIANNLDILNIGYNYGQIGPERLVQSTDWEAHAAFDWDLEFGTGSQNDPDTPPTNNSFNLVDTKYSDSDGTGIVDAGDVYAISQNYGLTHGKTAEEKEINEDIQITLEIRQENIEPGTWIDVDLFVDGADDQDVNNMYGIAFQIDYFNEYEGIEIVPADSIKIEFIDSWFNNDGADQTLSLFKNLNSLNGSSVLDIGYVKANHIGSSGGGAVARMSCFITENITGKTASEIPLYFKVINPTLVLDNGVLEELNGSLVESEINSTGTGVDPVYIYNELEVFPNPASDVISVNIEKFAEEITMVDALGRIHYQKENLYSGNQTISLDGIPTGIYLFKVKSGESMYIQKVIIN